MALVTGARIGLITYTLGTDPRPGRVQHNTERDLLESRLVIGDQGTSALRPTAGKGKALYWNTDRSVLQWDTGTGWEDVSTVGGGGTPASVVVGAIGVEGVALRGARADHSHGLPLATATTHGGMSSGDKAKLDGAVVTATGDRLVLRDINGRAQVAAPAASADIATKGYVDSTVGGAAAPVVTYETNGLATPTMLYSTDAVANADTLATADRLVLRDINGRAQFASPSVSSDAANKLYVDTQISSHRHDGTHITTGIIPAARLPLVTSTANGAMPTADKVKLDGATPSATNNTLVLRSSTGTIQVGAPSVAADATTKTYVDSGLAGKAATNHGHYATDITSGTMSAARLPYASASSDGILTASQFNQIGSHTHDTSAITTGIMSTARLPYAGSSSNGIIGSGTYNTIYNHSHDASDITSGIILHARVQGSKPAYDTTSSVNPGYTVYVDITGRFFRSTSTRRRKTNIKPWTPNPRDLLGPEPTVYNPILDDGTVIDRDEYGYIAEQAGETVPEFVQWGPDSTEDTEVKVQDWNYARSVVAQQVLARWFDKRLARIEEALGLGPIEDGA